MATIKRGSDFKKNSYEYEVWSHNRLVCGIDEVGRGCLAGPVVTAAVILHTKKVSRLIKDSKQLTPEERLRGYEWIERNGHWAIGIVHHRFIDQKNIYQATLSAMKRSVMQLLVRTSEAPALILIDAMPLSIDFFEGDIIAFPHGESKSVSIAAASIVAKVTRDKLMSRLDGSFPGYGFQQHKGYYTVEHRKQLKQLQPSIIHRKSFIDHLDDFGNFEENQLNFLHDHDNQDEHENILW